MRIDFDMAFRSHEDVQFVLEVSHVPGPDDDKVTDVLPFIGKP